MGAKAVRPGSNQGIQNGLEHEAKKKGKNIKYLKVSYISGQMAVRHTNFVTSSASYSYV